MIHGETVTIIRREQHGFTPGGEPDWRHLPEENVDDVLVAPGAQSNATVSVLVSNLCNLMAIMCNSITNLRMGVVKDCLRRVG